MLRKVCAIAILGILTTPCLAAGVTDAKPAVAAEVKTEGKLTTEPTRKVTDKVSIKADDMKLSEVISSLAKQTNEKFVVESSVAGQIKLSLSDVTLDDALNAISKASGKMQWRKLYVPKGCDLIEQPEKFAATVRLMTGLSFPNMVMAGSSTGKTAAHFDDKAGVTAAEESAAKTLGMVKVYLITNDSADAAKAASAEKKKAVADYKKLAKDQMDAFMKMTPEEREQAIISGLDMMNQVGPEYLGAVMDTMSKNPDVLRNHMANQMNMLSSMSVESRRAMIRMNMEAMKYITPELQQQLAEDAKAIAEEMQAQQGGN